MKTLDRILAAPSLQSLWEDGLLPEPYDDGGFYLVYYAEADYKAALSDIVQYHDLGLRIYYDRYLESGDWHRRDFAEHALSTHCRAVIFYLSEAAILDPTLHLLAKTVAEYNIPFLSLSLADCAGATLARGHALPAEAQADIALLFAPEITYLPPSTPISERAAALRRAGSAAEMRYRLEGDFAVAAYVRDTSEEEIVIPSHVEIDGRPYPVRAVDARAFAGCAHLKSIRLPDTLEFIGYGCEDPSESAVFAGCEALTELRIPEGVRELPGGMLRGCTSLRRLTLPSAAVFIGDPAAFFDLRPPLDDSPIAPNEDGLTVAAVLEAVTLPKCVQIVSTVRDYLGCVIPSDTGFAYVLLRASTHAGGCPVEIAREHTLTHPAELFCFSGNTEVERVTAAEDFYFGPAWNSAFHNCTSLREVTLPETVREINKLFAGCSALTHVHLPTSLARIGALSFSGCKALSSITLPRYLFALEENALVGSGIREIVSDSLYSEAILAGGVPYPYHVLATKNRLLRALRKLLVRLSYRQKEPEVLSEKPFYMWGSVETIYVTREVRQLSLYGCREVESDRDGYRKYRFVLSEVDKLKYMSARLGK